MNVLNLPRARSPSSDRQTAAPDISFADGAADLLPAPDWCDLFTRVLDRDVYLLNAAALSQVNRASYNYSKTLLLRSPEESMPTGFSHQNAKMRQQRLRSIVARIAPAAARDAVWLGNTLSRPIEALGLQAQFVGSLMPRAQLKSLHAAAQHYCSEDGPGKNPLNSASRLAASSQGPDGAWTVWEGTEPNFISTVASILSAVLVGDGTAFFWQDKVDAHQQVQSWLAASRPGLGTGPSSAWSAEDTHRLHNLLCLLGHDPLQAWIDHEMRLAGQAGRDYRDDLTAIRSLQLEQIFLAQATPQRMYPYQTDSISAAVCRPRTVSPLCSSLRVLTSINLSGLQLQEIPQSLSTLTNLLEADFDNNQLRDFPAVLMSWPKLKNLSLSSNTLDTHALGLVQLPALQTLRLCHNNLTAVPEGLSQFTDLKDLYLYANPLATLPQFLATLPNLRLIVAYNTAVVERPAQFGARPDLKLLLS
jgi:hypothetical protein